MAFFDLLTVPERRAVLDTRGAALAEHHAVLAGLGSRADAEAGRSQGWGREVVDLHLRMVATEQDWLTGLVERLEAADAG